MTLSIFVPHLQRKSAVRKVVFAGVLSRGFSVFLRCVDCFEVDLFGTHYHRGSTSQYVGSLSDAIIFVTFPIDV